MVFGYYILWRFGKRDGLTAEELDEIAESNLKRATQMEIDFEVGDALEKLRALEVVREVDGRWQAIGIGQSLANLDFRWDSVFAYHWPPAAQNDNSGS